MLEINILDKRWYSVTVDPENFALDIINFSLKLLKIDHYKPNISIALANDDLLYQLNLKFRKIDKPTNVLSFQCEQLHNKCDLGDIAISIDTIKKESNKQHTYILAYVAHILVHGLLHLLDYNHQKADERITMENIEREILTSLGDNYDLTKKKLSKKLVKNTKMCYSLRGEELF